MVVPLAPCRQRPSGHVGPEAAILEGVTVFDVVD
jgi:hypothetical protein